MVGEGGLPGDPERHGAAVAGADQGGHGLEDHGAHWDGAAWDGNRMEGGNHGFGFNHKDNAHGKSLIGLRF